MRRERWWEVNMAGRAWAVTAGAVAVLAAVAVAGGVATGTAKGSVAGARARREFLKEYKGKPYEDTRYHGGAQKIPGRVECAYYDLGGAGVAYHDTDAKNNGSGALNPADGTYLNEFRMKEGVDTSYTKFHDAIDKNPYNAVQPKENQLYVGWTEPGEWFNVTVEVAKAGEYAGDLLYTSNRGGAIAVDVNGEAATGPVEIASTYDAKDPIAWRQWHHWNVANGLVKLKLAKGKNVLTVRILKEGNMNLAWWEFREAGN